jgi:hypothetical protein
MNDNDTEPRPETDRAPDGAADRPPAEPVTPRDAPSALERGARIFERLHRRPR